MGISAVATRPPSSFAIDAACGGGSGPGRVSVVTSSPPGVAAICVTSSRAPRKMSSSAKRMPRWSGMSVASRSAITSWSSARTAP